MHAPQGPGRYARNFAPMPAASVVVSFDTSTLIHQLRVVFTDTRINPHGAVTTLRSRGCAP